MFPAPSQGRHGGLPLRPCRRQGARGFSGVEAGRGRRAGGAGRRQGRWNQGGRQDVRGRRERAVCKREDPAAGRVNPASPRSGHPPSPGGSRTSPAATSPGRPPGRGDTLPEATPLRTTTRGGRQIARQIAWLPAGLEVEGQQVCPATQAPCGERADSRAPAPYPGAWRRKRWTARVRRAAPIPPSHNSWRQRTPTPAPFKKTARTTSRK